MKHIKTYEIFGFGNKKKLEEKKEKNIDKLKEKILATNEIKMSELYKTITWGKHLATGLPNIIYIMHFLKPILENKVVDIYLDNEIIKSLFFVQEVGWLDEDQCVLLINDREKVTHFEPEIGPYHIHLNRNHIINILEAETDAIKYNL